MAALSEADRAARITQQFRERFNMTYELDCAGAPLIVRVFRNEEGAAGDEWRLEARSSDVPGAFVASATGPSRLDAFRQVAGWWREHAMARALPTLDWDAVARAMTAVRAL